MTTSRPSTAGYDLRAGARVLRVEVSKLDRMLSLAGDIALSRRRLTELLERRTSLSVDEILEAHREADRLCGDLQDLIAGARLVSLGPLFRQQLRTLPELAAAERKQVRLVLEGEDVEVDAALVEHIRDPLGHMIAGAVDQGIEPPEERAALGKDACGTISLRAFHEGGEVLVEVADDGGGDREPWTDASGREAGMEVACRNVKALGGSVSVASERGRGTTVTLRMPLALAAVQGFRVSVSGVVYVLPLACVAECLELPEGAGRVRRGVLHLRGRPVPFVRLREQLGLAGERPDREDVVVVRHAGASVGLAVDALLGEGRAVIQPLDRVLQGVPTLAGSAVLGDGSVALVLDVPALAREALARAASSCALASA